MTANAVLLPVKGFDAAKARLSPELGDADRAALARRLAEGVVAACAGHRVVVVCEDELVADWAANQGVEAIRNARPGLNAAVRHGMRALAREGTRRVLVAHADLACPTALPRLFDLVGVVLAPDRHLDGTNAVVVPATSGFSFSYGPGSFARHLSEAERLGQPVHVVRDLGLELDLDDPSDLELYRSTRSERGGPK